MYFMLGSVAFEPVDLTDFNETHAADFAEHAVLKGKPRLQAMGEKLTELNFAIRLHHTLGGVERRYQELLGAKSKQAALPLIIGRGKYKGNFVITDISSVTLFTDKLGNALCREMNISLKEFIGDIEETPLGAAFNIGGGSLLGSMLPPAFMAGFNGVKGMLEKGIAVYKKAMVVVNDVRETVQTVRQLANDPLAAISYLPGVLGNLDAALGGFGEVTGLSKAFEGVRFGLSALGDMSEEVQGFSNDVSAMMNEIETMRNEFSEMGEGSDWSVFGTKADSHFNVYDDLRAQADERAARMTAWIVLRKDEDVIDDTTDRT